MNKLVSFQILEARNVICIYNGAGRDVFSEVQCDDAEEDFIVPSHIVVGVFDNGVMKMAGVEDFGHILLYANNTNQVNYAINGYENLFLYDLLVQKVGIYLAKSFVRGYLNDGNYGNDEHLIKCIVYEQLLRSGVTIAKEAERWLLCNILD